jgi:biopolymer transport protein ExbD
MTKESKIILVVAIVLAAGVAIAVPIAVKHYSKSNSAKTNPQQIREHTDSNQFRDANGNKRSEMAEAMRTKMEAQANEYAALPDAQKTAYLDKIIDDMQAARAKSLAGDANSPQDPNRFGRFGPRDPNSMGQQMARQPSRRPAPSRMREMPPRLGSDTRVKMNQFRRDLMNRMQERGIQNPMMEGPGGRGGFGGPAGPPPGAIGDRPPSQ